MQKGLANGHIREHLLECSRKTLRSKATKNTKSVLFFVPVIKDLGGNISCCQLNRQLLQTKAP